MDENTIFGGLKPPPGTQTSLPAQPAPSGQPPVPQIPQPIPKPLTQPSITNLRPNPLPPPTTPPGIPPPPAGSPPAPAKKTLPFLKIGIITAVLLLIVGLLAVFLVPRFFKSSSSNQQVTLTYWGLWEGEDIMKSIIADFEKQNPNIKVTYVKQDIKDYRNRLNARMENGSGPDIFRFHNSWLPMLSSTLLPLPSDVITSQKFNSSYYPTVQKDLVKNGAIYGIPLYIDTLALFTNTELFTAAGAQPPMTWDEFINVARLLTVKDENGKIKTAGAALGMYDNIDHAPDILSMLFLQNGADLKDLSSTMQNASDTITFYISFAQGDTRVWDETMDSSRLAFGRGNLAMFFGYSWDIFAIKAINPNLSFKIYPVPHLLDRNMSIASYWVEGASVKSPHKNEVLKFMKFLAQKEVQQKLYSEESKARLFGEPYSRVDLGESLKGNELVYPFIQQAKQAQSSFFVSDTADDGLNTQANSYLGNAIRSLFIRTSPESAIKTLSDGVHQVLSQYGAL